MSSRNRGPSAPASSGSQAVVDTSLLARAVKRVGAEKVARILGQDGADGLQWCWEAIARPSQLPPRGDWSTWLFLGGRGSGKTMAGAEWIRSVARENPGCRIALVAPTAADARDTMVEGMSGIVAVSPDEEKPHYRPSTRRVRWRNGTTATLFSADVPDRLRGPQHHFAWADELAAWQHCQDAWDMLALGLRAGSRPQTVVTTTPRPLGVIKRMVRRAEESEDVRVTTASTYDNSANLPQRFLDEILSQYEGTRLGEQELHARILDDVLGALWVMDRIAEHRVAEVPDLQRVVVAVDPAVTSHQRSDWTGIVVAGLGVDGLGYLLDDRSCRLSPDGWGRRVVEAYHEFNADRVVAEVNNGGDLVESVIRTIDRQVSYRAVRASRGKIARAEPVAALHEQGRIKHVGLHRALEAQLGAMSTRGYEGEGSPDRADAYVWAFTELMLGAKPAILTQLQPRALTLGLEGGSLAID